MIGGENKIVEIDETLIIKKKNEKGRDSKKIWILKGI
jgi:hypothetical protein